MSFKERLKKARQAKNLTQAQLADLCGLTQPAITRLESGAVKATTYITKLAEVLDVSAKWLEEGEEGDDKLNFLKKQKDQNHDYDLIMARIAPHKIPLLEWSDFDIYKTTPATLLSIDDILSIVREKSRMFTVYLDEKEVSSRLAALVINNLDAMKPITFHEWALMNGNIVIIDFNLKPLPGDIVLAKVNNSVTVRLFEMDADKQVLKPLNTQYPIITENFEVLGTIIQVIRKRDEK